MPADEANDPARNPPRDALVERTLGPCPFAEGDRRAEAWLILGRMLAEANARTHADLLARAAEAHPDELPDLLVEAFVRSAI